MARTRRAVLCVVALVLPLSATAAWGSTRHALPAGVAAAAHRPEPRLPKPKAWTAPDAFSRTSGTGRLVGGAFEWTDWVYDAYGAFSQTAAPNSITQAADSLSPAKGSYVYPAGPAKDNGADIFRAAVQITRAATVWRVDWNTLVDPNVPVAEWTFDTDNNAKTGASTWPAGANVSSPGIERALVVTASRARLIDAASGKTLATYATVADSRSRSFLVAVPRHDLPARGTWRIRLAAGLADRASGGFAVPTLSGGGSAAATAPRVYNVTFRTAKQEPSLYPPAGAPSGEGATDNVAAGADHVLRANFWAETDQATTLAAGDVSKFSRLVDWRRLRARRTTKPPFLHGWSDRWYVTDLNLGQGVDSSSNANPAFLGRIQPYAVYVPKAYVPGHAIPLTWTLHSASVNYNQYQVVNPRLVRQVCEERGTICASTEGFGGNGLYAGIAEHDFWQVWRELAEAFDLRSDRTVMTGYSMGGLASFVLPTSYPSLFAAAMPLDGGFDEGCSSAPAGVANFAIAAATDRSPNVRWVPFVISDSYTDELSPYPNNGELARRLQAAGVRFTLFSTTTPEHVTTDLADGFSTQVAALGGTPLAKRRPGTIDHTWCAAAVDRKLGLGPTQVYWLSGLAQRTTAGNAVSRIVADDGALPERAVTEKVDASAVSPPDAPPMQVLTGSWVLGGMPAARPTLKLTLTNVAALTIDAAAARLPSGIATVTTDGKTTIRLARLARGTVVKPVPAGTSTISW